MFHGLPSLLDFKLLKGHNSIFYFCFIPWLFLNREINAMGFKLLMGTMTGNKYRWYSQLLQWWELLDTFQKYSSRPKSKANILQIYNKAIINDKSSKLRQNKNVLSSGTNREFSISPNVSQIKKYWGTEVSKKQTWDRWR